MSRLIWYAASALCGDGEPSRRALRAATLAAESLPADMADSLAAITFRARWYYANLGGK